MVMLNISSLFPEIPFPSFPPAVNTLVTAVQEKALEIFQSGIEYLNEAHETHRPLLRVAAFTGIAICTVHLFQSLTAKSKPKQVRTPQNHLITLPGAADLVFRGHRCDPKDPLNLFETKLNRERVLECATKEETQKLRRFFISHLKTKLNRDFVIQKTEEWALTISQKLPHECFSTLLFRGPRYRQLCETQKFMMKLCWNLFIGSGNPPEGFGSVIRDEGEYSYTLSDIDILRDAMYENGMTEDTMVLNMVNDFEVGCGIFASMVSHGLSVLCEDPELQDQLFQELSDLKKEDKSIQEVANESRLLFMIIAESLRTFEGIGLLGRANARKEFVIENPTRFQKEIVVKPGDSVTVNHNIMKNDPEIVGPNPEEFNIHRPYTADISNVQAMEWRPFAKGKHSCPAATAVQTLTEIIMATLFSKYKISTKYDVVNVTLRETVID